MIGRGPVFAVLIFFALAASGLAVAQTSDDTPAEESVCDVLLEDGVTPGLYGLCVAFCEAHDADDTDLDAECNPSDNKILDNYNRKRQPSDPDMPCVQPDCPCWSTEELANLIVDDEQGCRLYACSERIRYDKLGNIEYFRSRIVHQKDWAEVTGKAYAGIARCVFRYHKIYRVFDITIDEGLACRDSLHTAADPTCFD